MNGLSEKFMINFLDDNGILNPIYSRLKRDHTLMLAIRKNYVNIYYRGGNILKITELSKGYRTLFNENYKITDSEHDIPQSPNAILTKDDAQNWVNSFAERKIIMDEFFAEKCKSEREFQQLVARENNNSSISGQCEYFIADIEFAVPELGRFDMLAIRWLAKDRKKGSKCRAALIEMKYGDNALGEEAGLVKHLRDMETFISDKQQRTELFYIMETRFNQLDQLGLLNFNKGTSNAKVRLNPNDKPELIFILANHNPRSSKLGKILNEIDEFGNSELFDLKFYVANFAGYGLHANCMRTLTEFKDLCTVKREKED
jgi:hypothetical protein